ncbi:MAG: DMT family transporter [Clostridia bacterium]|nr:DMT family transporter [Clostridia bacterium]
MVTGIFAGITWAVETVILGIALSMTPFISGESAILLAPFISTFLHDASSAIYMWCFNGIKGNLKEIFKIVITKNFKWLLLASAIGGPVGMTGYVLAVNYMGSSVGAVATAVYPAIGSVLAYLFLKEKIRWHQWIFLLLTMLGVYGLSYSPELNIVNFRLGLCGVIMCAFGWGLEGVILSKCFKDEEMKSEYALQLRQTTSAVLYGTIIIPALNGWGFVSELFVQENIITLLVIAISALFATISYLLYYKTIAKIGVSKAMGLNITYTAWAIFFTVIILRDCGVLNVLTVSCAVVVVVCGLFAATDFKEIFSFLNKKKEL